MEKQDYLWYNFGKKRGNEMISLFPSVLYHQFVGRALCNYCFNNEIVGEDL